MTAIMIVIHYADDEAFNSRVRDMVDQIFGTCFDTLEEDQVFITWLKGCVPDSETGRKKAGNEWHINLNNKLKLKDYVGQSAGYESNINVSKVKKVVSDPKINGNIDAAMANVIAHEIGVHVIADYDFSHPDPEGPLDVGNAGQTKDLCCHPGYFSPPVCAHMRIELARVTWLS